MAARGLIGVLALQGGVEPHLSALGRLPDLASRRVFRAQDLAGLDGLIIPGGESTAVRRLLTEDRRGRELHDALMERLRSGLAAWGTCMGAILLSRHFLAVMDIGVERNAYGGQLDSFTAEAEIAGIPGGPFPLVFIRAPAISDAGPEVEVLARHGGRAVACRQGRLVATTFHPELSSDLRFHAFFAHMALSRDGAPVLPVIEAAAEEAAVRA